MLLLPKTLVIALALVAWVSALSLAPVPAAFKVSTSAAADLPANPATAFRQTLVQLVTEYDASPDWHERFESMVAVEAWEYDSAEMDAVMAFVRGLEVEEVRHGEYTTASGDTAWYCEVRFKGSKDALPTILDLTFERVAGVFRVRSVSRDFC